MLLGHEAVVQEASKKSAPWFLQLGSMDLGPCLLVKSKTPRVRQTDQDNYRSWQLTSIHLYNLSEATVDHVCLSADLAAMLGNHLLHMDHAGRPERPALASEAWQSETALLQHMGCQNQHSTLC